VRVPQRRQQRRVHGAYQWPTGELPVPRLEEGADDGADAGEDAALHGAQACLGQARAQVREEVDQVHL